ncbi:MAG: hypothetical protein QMD12_02855 [Candidatus Aenigmarchaeota archaeon]|nr:hypothetical protein [Candidatus Aenigmarchaeota archaeon]
MKVEQVVVLAFFSLGILSGSISNYFVKAQESLMLALILPVIIYFIFLSLFKKLVKAKKFRWLIYNSLVTFVLIWLVVWFALHAL